MRKELNTLVKKFKKNNTEITLAETNCFIKRQECHNKHCLLIGFVLIFFLINISYAQNNTSFLPTMSYLNGLTSKGIKAAYYNGEVYFISGETNTISDTTIFYTDAFLTNVANVDNKNNYSIQNITTKGGYFIEQISDDTYSNASKQDNAPLFQKKSQNSTKNYTWTIPDLTIYKTSLNEEVFTTIDSGNGGVSYYSIDLNGNVTSHTYYYTGVIENDTADYVSGNVIGQSASQIGYHPIQTNVIDAFFLNTYSISSNPNEDSFIVNGDFINNTDDHADESGNAIRHSDGLPALSLLSGVFLGNSGNGYGGAIYNDEGQINNIIGDFVINQSKKGGAIYNSGQIDSIFGDFISNKTYESETFNAGGAIYNVGISTNTGIINSVSGNFIGNQSATNGGAIYNIQGTVSINSYNTELLFAENIAQKGGAIYNYIPYNNPINGIVSINTNGQSLQFLHNMAESGGGIYNDGGIVNINATDGDVVFFENTQGAIVNTRYNTYANTPIINISATGGDVIFGNNPDGAIVDLGSGEINFYTSDEYAISFLTDSDDVIMNNTSINIGFGSRVNMSDVVGTGTINNNHGILKISGTIDTDVTINNNAGNVYALADYVSNIYSYDYGILTLTGGVLFEQPNQSKYIIDGDIISTTSLMNNDISLIAGSLSVSADNISNSTIVNHGTIYLTSGVIYNVAFSNYNRGDIVLNGSVINNNSNICANNVIIPQFQSLTTDASYLHQVNNIVNDGILYLTGGSIAKDLCGDSNILGSGTIITTGDVLADINTLGNNIINNHTLTLSSEGTLSKNITGSGMLAINGSITVDDNVVITQDIVINPDKLLAISANNINSNISNNGTLALSGGTLTQQISGNINIIGNVHTSASNLLSDNVTNDSHNLTLTGGTLAHSITGAGNTIIDGEVVISDPAYNNIVAITNNININSGAKLYTHANALQNNVQNSGDLHLTGGMLDSNVTGGNTIIDGNIDNKALLNTSIIINNTKTLSTTADNIAGQVNNNGTLALNGGILNQQIIGNGTININAEVHSSADKFQGSGFINNASNLFFTDGTLEQVVSGNGNIVIGGLVQSYAANLLNNVIVSDENALTLTGGTLSRVINTTGQGKVVIDGHVSTAASNLLTDVSVNSEKTLTLSGGALNTNITGAGLVEIDGMVEIANNKTVDTNVAINTDKSLTAPINSIGGAVINNGLLILTDGGTLSGVISGSGNIVAKANVDKITTSADYLQNPLQLQSSATKVVLTDGTLNNKINGGSIVVAGNVNSHANNIGADVSNNGTFVLTGGTLTHHINGAGDFEIGSGTLTTNADMLQMSKITNNGVLDITSGILTQDVVGGKTIIADGAGISSKNIGDLELHGNMYVGNNMITAANTTLNGTVNMDIEKISANSNEYIGGHLIADNVSLGDNSKLNLTIYNTDLLKGESTGNISLISTNGDWSGSFGSIFQNNNRYSISFDDTTKTFAITHVKIGADVIAEAGGTNDDIAVASAWDDLPSSTLPNVQRIIDEINHRSQHDTDGYLQLIKSLQPVKTNVVHGVSRSLNNAINTQITERLTAVTPMGRNGGDTQAKTGVWAQGMYNKSNQSGDYSFNGNTIGVIAGFDTTFGANITMGAGYAFSTTDVEADMRNLEIDGHNLFIYGKYQGSNWHVNANLSYGMSDYTDNATALDLNNSRYARRIIPTQNSKNGGTSLSDSEYSTNTIGASALFGYGISENIDINIGTRFNHITVDDYTDMAGQSVSVEDMDFMTVLGGFSYGKQGQNWTPVIHIAATYDVLSDDYIANVDLGGSGYVINGENIDPFGIEAGISLETNGDIWDFSIGYDIEWHSNFISHTGKAKLKYNF